MSDCCTPRRPTGEPTPFERGAAEIATGRRALLGAAGGAIAFSTAALAGAPIADAAPGRGRRTAKRAYVLVIDGCLPEEIDGGLTPNLKKLRDGGLRFPQARSMPVMETIPNHVMMMTGVRPDRTGVPSNTIYDRKLKDVRTIERPSDIKVDTVIERMGRNGLRTGTVLSKDYLYGVFGGRATARWEPAPIIPISGHAPDVFTMRAALAMLDDVDPHLMFVNLGDIDRFGHTDVTGGVGIKALRRIALASTDALIGQFIGRLKSSGKWQDSIVVVLADHSMDWSLPHRVVSLAGPLDKDPFLRGKVQIACNGGADLLYWTGPRNQREKAIRRMRAVAERVEGVLVAHDRREPELRLGPEAGEVLVYCKAGWRFSDPDPVTDNPIPGNHGHPATHAIPFFIGGGHSAVPRRRASTRTARTIDVAPTVASFFGLSGAPRGGWDGVDLLA
ncbi:alkaline phosphatase family protein [Nocardioides sp. R-C-SC26]|uniref:alkaline phosphatase family protein n=1 Tax=Nocardioides sp. R-C-SC26 TaxID=2870414 RepID=UPI001E5B6C26|nr:nucleotide pyrophosphatase/phosphodiesterase family protein [Nocardioides sp. R-C-SC26]